MADRFAHDPAARLAAAKAAHRESLFDARPDNEPALVTALAAAVDELGQEVTRLRAACRWVVDRARVAPQDRIGGAAAVCAEALGEDD